MIIGISGVAGSGKDTVADLLVRNHGFVKMSLADEMKRACARIYGFTQEQLWGPSKFRNAPDHRFPRRHTFKALGILTCACCGFEWIDQRENPPPCYLTPRYALQTLGTEWGRDCYEDTWVALVLRDYARLQGGGCVYDQFEGMRPFTYVGDMMRPKTNVVVADVRWPTGNEGRMIRTAGGKLLRVRRGSGLGGAAGQHESETAMEEAPDSYFDVVLHNDGPLEELPSRVADMFSGLSG